MSELGHSTGKVEVDVMVSAEHFVSEVPQLSAGELIQQAREAAGLSLATLSAVLKIPVSKLEDLEAGRLDSLPDVVFVRALASSVCRSLKLDVSTVLERLPRTSAPTLICRGAGINAPFHQPADGASASLWSGVSRPAMLGGAVLLFAAMALALLPVLENRVFSAISGALSASGAGPVVVNPANTQLTSTSEKSQTPPPELKLADVPAAPLLNPPALPASGLAAEGAALAGAGSGAAVGIVVFSAKTESWVEVTDTRGAVVLRRILAAGETLGASGALPLSVVVGRADTTQVLVRGSALDLAPLARDNVARFEVK